MRKVLIFLVLFTGISAPVQPGNMSDKALLCMRNAEFRMEAARSEYLRIQQQDYSVKLLQKADMERALSLYEQARTDYERCRYDYEFWIKSKTR